MLIAFLASSAAALPPKPAVDPAGWFSPDTYPAEATDKGLQGTVDFQVDVDAAGNPGACRISKSSGQAVLDKATCDAIRAKAHFDPAKDSNGKPITSQYSNTAVWKLVPPSPGHSAVILKFTDDSSHPSCTTQAVGSSSAAPTCAQLLEKLGPALSALGARFTQIAVLTSAASAGQEPYRGETDWGVRLSYLASDQYFLSGPKPIACVSVAAEGMDAGQDACARMGARQSSDENLEKGTRKMRLEVSIYGAPRK